jgi:hypothetical protein
VLVHDNTCANVYLYLKKKKCIILWTKGKCTRARLSIAKKKKKESFLYIFCMKSDLKINLSGVTFAKQNSLFYFL